MPLQKIHYKQNDFERQFYCSGLINDVTINTVRSRSGTYDVITSAVFSAESLTTLTVFDCELRIPGTFYQKRKTTLFFPGKLRCSLVNSLTYFSKFNLRYLAALGVSSTLCDSFNIDSMLGYLISIPVHLWDHNS